MKPWQRQLGRIRELGPDVPRFRRDVKLVYEHIEALEAALRKREAELKRRAPLHTSLKG